ncbi:MAG: SPFH domain-containing protein, partial [bacterium]|nr:SPFH domain-containing protein [bacterium]
MPFTSLLIILIIIVLASIRQIAQYERGIRFTFGRYSGLMNPGWRLVWPIIQFYKKVDLRVKAVDVP